MTALTSIQVYYNGYSEHRLVGTLTLAGSRPVFGYDASWLSNSLPLSPLEMPTNATQPLFYGKHASAHYVCGLLADSLPDGWGMLLMDRFFQKHLSKQRHEISVLERFAYIGASDRIIGALSFQPEQHHNHLEPDLDLFAMACANEEVLAGQDSDILQELLIMGGSAQGARPKSLLYYDPATDFISTQRDVNNTSLQPWLIKFPAQNEHKGVCLLESLYADYARQAGLNMPAHRYFDISDTHGAFAVQRFDRVCISNQTSNQITAQNNDNTHTQRKHVHTLAGLLDMDFRIPSFDYMQFLRCVRFMTNSHQQVELAYRQVVFNVVFNNKDDHTKNFSFMMDDTGAWALTPVYDLTYNTGINGYHQMDVCGEAKYPNYQQLLQLAKLADIKANRAKAIIEQVTSVAETMLSELPHHAINADLRKQVSTDIQANIEWMTSQ